MLNWDHLRYFIAVADHGSVSRAGKALGVSHATILRAIGRLEKVLEIRLFDHARTGYKLTDDGIAMLHYARNMEGEVQQLQVQARARDSVPSGELNLAVPDQTIFDYMPLLREFRIKHPNIVINLKQVDVLEPDDFIKYGVDMLLLISNDAPEALVGRQIGRVRFRVYAHRDYQNSTDHLCDWIQWRLPGGIATSSMDQQQTHIQRLLGIQPPRVMDAGNHDRAIKAVNAGLGMGLIATDSVTADMLEIPVAGTLPDWGLWCLTHPDYRHAGRVHAFMRFLADTLSTDSRPT